MKKVLAKAACVAFVFVTGLAFVACPNNVNGPSSGSGEAPAETLETPVGAVNPFKGKKYSDGQYRQYRFKDSDECIVEEWFDNGDSGNFELDYEYKYTYDTEKNTLTLAKNKVRSFFSDEYINALGVYMKSQLEYQYATIKGETATQPGSYPSRSYAWYTYSELKAQYKKMSDKILPLYDEYIAKFEALLNDSQYAGKKTQIEAGISNLKQEKSKCSASAFTSVLASEFGDPQVFKYAVNDTNLTLTTQYSGKLNSKNYSSWNAKSASGIVSLDSFSNSSGSNFYFSGNGYVAVQNSTISNGTISGTYYKSQSGDTEEQIPVSLAYSTTGSGNDTKLKINFTNAPDDLKALVENAAELEFSYDPDVMNWTEITE